MPFTVSHVAAVLPLHKPLRHLGLLSAAAIGAMAPDLDLMLPTRLPRGETHGRLALLTFCLPVGLAAWALFQALIKPALIEVLPDRVYTRLRAEHIGPRLASVKTWFYAALAVLLGALTHIVWDGFTHEDELSVRLLPVFGEPGPDLGGSAWHWYGWAQHASSVVGMVAVLLALGIWLHHSRQPSPPPERRLTARERHGWLAVCVLTPVLQVVAAVVELHHKGWPYLYSTEALALFTVTGINGAILALVFTSALVRRRLLILGARRPSPDP